MTNSQTSVAPTEMSANRSTTQAVSVGFLHTIPAQTGIGFKLARGQLLKVTDPEGAQVSDLYCVADDDSEDALSSGRSIDYSETILFTKGHTLYANSGRAMLEIIEDSCGTHDFLVTPCSQQMFTMMSHSSEYHPSCLENIEQGFESLGVKPGRIGTSFNIFMNVPFTQNGKIKVSKPLSKAGDSLTVRALMDLSVVLTACSDEGSNGGSCKPIQFMILP